MFGTQHQQGAMSHHQELHGALKDNPSDKLRDLCKCHYQVRCIPIRSSVSAVVLHRPKPPEPLTSGCGCRLKNLTTLSHFLSMDNIKC